MEQNHATTQEMEMLGYDHLKAQAELLGKKVRSLLASRGFDSIAAPGFESPTVVVVHCKDAGIAGKFAKAGLQVAAGVPLMVDHGTNEISENFRTFRIGLFGLDKLTDIDGCVDSLAKALSEVIGSI